MTEKDYRKHYNGRNIRPNIIFKTDEFRRMKSVSNFKMNYSQRGLKIIGPRDVRVSYITLQGSTMDPCKCSDLIPDARSC